MILGEKEFEQFVNVYTFRMRNVLPIRYDVAQLIAEGHKARLLIEIMPVKTPEYELYISKYGIPETDAAYISMLTWCLAGNTLLLRNYLVYILSVEHEIARITLKWVNELKELFELNPKVVV
jgi:hypothetical protein